MNAKELCEVAAKELECLTPWQIELERDKDTPPEMIKDCGAVCEVLRTYLAEHAADDDEPVSEDWFRKFTDNEPGLDIDSSREWYLACDGDGDEITLQFERSSKKMPNSDCWAMCCVSIKTRGQFRQLCRALGVELKEVK